MATATITTKRRETKDGRKLIDVLADGKFVGYVERQRIAGELRGERWAWCAAVRFEPRYLNTFHDRMRDAVADVAERAPESGFQPSSSVR